MGNKLGIIVFANDSGLGAQTRRLTYMLNPHRILAIDSSGFSKNTKQHFDWYDGFSGYRVHGFPTNREIQIFLRDLTHVIVCENPLNFHLLTYAKRLGVKVYIQSNYEFCDHLDKDLELPEKFLMPSHWMIQEMKDRFGENLVQYLPPPIDPEEFKAAREENLARKSTIPRLLHIVGTLAAHDRNGTLDLLQSLEHTKSDFQLVIRSQHELPPEYQKNDQRLIYEVGNIAESNMMYAGFDAMILPRRYGGLSLTTNEALMSALPVVMSDVSPNRELLPSQWLVPATKVAEFTTRTIIDIHRTDPYALAQKIDWICAQDLAKLKSQAFEIGYNNFSESSLRPEYEKLLV